MEIHLDAYVLPEDHSVYKFFPGKSYKFRDQIIGAEVVFLDVRGIHEITASQKPWTHEAIKQAAFQDRATRYLESRAEEVEEEKSFRVGPNDAKHATMVHGLLYSAKKGDIIIMSAPRYQTDIYFGELLDDPGDLVRVKAVDNGVEREYPGRRVKWRTKKSKFSLSPNLEMLLYTQNAFFLIGDRNLKREIYSTCYKNFIYRGLYASSFRVSKEHFTPSNHAVVATWFNAVASIRDAVQSGDLSQIQDLTYLELGIQQSANDTDGEMTININSPGDVILWSYTAFALASMSLYGLTEANAQMEEAKSATVIVKTIGTANSDCALDISEKITEYIDAMGGQRWKDHCKNGQRAKSEASLSTDVKVVAKKEKH